MNEKVYKDEFSHTLLHKQNIFDKPKEESKLEDKMKDLNINKDSETDDISKMYSDYMAGDT